MENSSNERGKHQVAITNDDDEINFVSANIASQSFGKYLGDTDTDTKNSILASSRRCVWYYELRNCPGYYSAWSYKSNFLLYLYETPVHRYHLYLQLARACRRAFPSAAYFSMS